MTDYLRNTFRLFLLKKYIFHREDRDGTPNGTKVVQFFTFFGVPPDGWKREAFATNP